MIKTNTNLLTEANTEEIRVAKFISKLGELGSNLRIARMRAQGNIKAFLENITEDDYALFLYRPDLEQYIFPTPNFKHIITVKSPTEIMSLSTKNKIKQLAKRGVLSKDIGLRMLFFENRELALEAFQTTKNEVYVKMNSSIQENKPCWKGYEMVGMKNKNGKQVPNCVPISEANVIRALSEGDTEYERYFKKMLRRTGKSSPAEMDDREKRIFFMKLDRGWKAPDEPKKETEKNTKQENAMTLTLQERRYIAKKVIESNRKTISEAKNNSKIKREIKLNLEFYNGLKESTPLKDKVPVNESMTIIMGLYTIFGTLKDILTSIAFVSMILTGIKKWFANTFGDTWFGKKAEEWADKGKAMLKKFQDILGPKGIAFIIAFFKYKGKVSKENIDKEMGLAKKIHTAIMVVLICLAILAILKFIIPLMATTFAGTAPLSGLLGLTSMDGFGAAAFAAYGIPSKIHKIQKNRDKTGKELKDDGLLDDIQKEAESALDLAQDKLKQEAGDVADDKPPTLDQIPDEVEDAMKSGKDIGESRRFKLKSISESTLRKNKMNLKNKPKRY